MRTRSTRRGVAWAAAILVLAVGTAAATQGAGGAGSRGAVYLGMRLDAHHSKPGHVFYISGDVSGLTPGTTTMLDLTVTNPNPVALSVKSLTVHATGSDQPGCNASPLNIRTSNYNGPRFIVPAGNGTAAISVPITMPTTVDEACQDATFDLKYGGRAVQASGPVIKTLTIGLVGQGNLRFAPGSWIATGFQIRIKQTSAPAIIDVTDVTVSLPVFCSDGSTPAGGPLVLALPDRLFALAAGTSGWLPGSGSSWVTYQAAVQAPNLCAGIGSGALRNAGRASMTATVSATGSPVWIRFHDVIPVARHGHDLDCSSPVANPGAGSPNCVGAWSRKVAV